MENQRFSSPRCALTSFGTDNLPIRRSFKFLFLIELIMLPASWRITFFSTYLDYRRIIGGNLAVYETLYSGCITPANFSISILGVADCSQNSSIISCFQEIAHIFFSVTKREILITKILEQSCNNNYLSLMGIFLTHFNNGAIKELHFINANDLSSWRKLFL